MEQKLPFDINAAKEWLADNEILSIKAYGGGKIKIEYKSADYGKLNYFGETENTKIKTNVGGYELEAHVPHGHGMINGANYGGTFKGNFASGYRNGYGEFKFTNGETHKGNWKDDLFSGYGEYKWPIGTTYKGNFKDGLFSGYGEFKWADGETYKGNWKDGDRDGYGKVFNINNSLIKKGFWVNDVYTEDSKKNSNNTQSSTGWFEYPGDRSYIYQQRDNVWWTKNLKTNRESNISTNPKYQSSIDLLNAAKAANKLIAK